MMTAIELLRILDAKRIQTIQAANEAKTDLEAWQLSERWSAYFTASNVIAGILKEGTSPILEDTNQKTY